MKTLCVINLNPHISDLMFEDSFKLSSSIANSSFIQEYKEQIAMFL